MYKGRDLPIRRILLTGRNVHSRFNFDPTTVVFVQVGWWEYVPDDVPTYRWIAEIPVWWKIWDGEIYNLRLVIRGRELGDKLSGWV